MTNTIFDTTILGGGPTGLFAAFYCGLRNTSCKIIDSLPVLGGRLTAVYPEKFIYDVAGFPKVLAKDLVQNLVEQIAPYQTNICLEEHVLNLVYLTENNVWEIQTNKGTHWSKTIIIAAGVGLYSPKEHEAVSAKQFVNKGISYAVLKKSEYANKNVFVFGGGDSALDWANEFVEISRSVTLVHRSEKLRAHDDSIRKLMNSNAKIILNSEAVEFFGNDHLEGLILKDVDTGELTRHMCNAAVVMFGFNSSLGKMKEWGLEFKGTGIAVNEKMQTNLPGVFAAGDIARYDAKLDLIVTGFSEAAIAVAFAKNYINPKERPQPLHSTTIMELKEKRAKKG